MAVQAAHFKFFPKPRKMPVAQTVCCFEETFYAAQRTERGCVADQPQQRCQQESFTNFRRLAVGGRVFWG